MFSLDDSTKFELQEILPKNLHNLAFRAFKEKDYAGAVMELKVYENTIETVGTAEQKDQFYQAMMVFQSL